jgi:hypothetical protein
LAPAKAKTPIFPCSGLQFDCKFSQVATLCERLDPHLTLPFSSAIERVPRSHPCRHGSCRYNLNRREFEPILAFLLAVGAAVFGFFAGLALTAAIVVLVWPYSHVAVLLALTGLYGAAGISLYWRLVGLLRDWQALSASLGQLRKDRACLEKMLE